MPPRKLFPLLCLILCCLLGIPGCSEPANEAEPTGESSSQTEQSIAPPVAHSKPESSGETKTDAEPLLAEQEAIKSVWKQNGQTYKKVKAVMQVEYVSPRVFSADKTEEEFRAEHADIQPDEYTIKEWQESIWLAGERFRRERDITRLPRSEAWPATQMTYDGEREMHTLVRYKNDDRPPQGAVDARSPEELNDYWPFELEPLYKLVRNVDDYDHSDFWGSLVIARREQYKEADCLVIKVNEDDKTSTEYFIDPQQSHRIVKYHRLQEGTPAVTAEIDYQQVGETWVPAKWDIVEMKDGEEGPLSVKARQARVTVTEFTPEFTDDRSDLYALTFPVGAEVRMWGSSDKVLVAADEPEAAETVPDPTNPLDISVITAEALEQSDSEPIEMTHEPVDKVVAEYEGQPINLNTFCLDKEGNLLLSCGGEIHQLVLSEADKKELKEQGEDAEIDTSIQNKNSFILVHSPDLKFQKAIRIPFKATAITPLDDSSILIAGEGRIALVDRDGQILKSGSSPQIDDIDTYREQLVEQAKTEREEMQKLIAKDLEKIETQLDELKEVEEADRSRGQQRQFTALTFQQDFYQQHLKNLKNTDVNQMMDMQLQMKLRVPALSVTDKDIFVTVPSMEGYGFEVWRVDHEFNNPKMIVSDLRGCCGQMDVQARDDKLYVAENGRFRVASFDREGEKIGSFGKSDRSSRTGFGSCCNPMNVRCCSNGDILTAESSVGNIKRFSADGELLANIGHVSVTGGCKNVAIEYDESRDRYYMMDLPNHTVHVLHPSAVDEVTLNTNDDETSEQ